MRTNPKSYLTKNKVDIENCLIRSRRLYDDKRPGNWWFNFYTSDLDVYQNLLFCGALGLSNDDFDLLRVPITFLRKQLDKLDVGKNGSVHLYISKGNYIDIRTENKVCFDQFVERR